MKKILNISIIFLVLIIVFLARQNLLEKDNDTDHLNYDESNLTFTPEKNISKKVVKEKKRFKKEVLSIYVPEKKVDLIAEKIKKERMIETRELENIKIKEFELKINKDNFFNVLKEFEKLENEIILESEKLNKIRLLLIEIKIEKFPTLREEYAELLQNKYNEYSVYEEEGSIFFESYIFSELKERRAIYFELKDSLEMMNFKSIKFEFGGYKIKVYKLNSLKKDNEV